MKKKGHSDVNNQTWTEEEFVKASTLEEVES